MYKKSGESRRRGHLQVTALAPVGDELHEFCAGSIAVPGVEACPFKRCGAT